MSEDLAILLVLSAAYRACCIKDPNIEIMGESDASFLFYFNKLNYIWIGGKANPSVTDELYKNLQNGLEFFKKLWQC